MSRISTAVTVFMGVPAFAGLSIAVTRGARVVKAYRILNAVDIRTVNTAYDDPIAEPNTSVV